MAALLHWVVLAVRQAAPRLRSARTVLRTALRPRRWVFIPAPRQLVRLRSAAPCWGALLQAASEQSQSEGATAPDHLVCSVALLPRVSIRSPLVRASRLQPNVRHPSARLRLPAATPPSPWVIRLRPVPPVRTSPSVRPATPTLRTPRAVQLPLVVVRRRSAMALSQSATRTRPPATALWLRVEIKQLLATARSPWVTQTVQSATARSPSVRMPPPTLGRPPA